MNALQDKIVLITGAGKGSGRVLAQALAAQGATIAANDISPVNVEAVVEQIIAKGGRARAYIDDIAKKVAAQHIIKQVEDDFGRIDILINHASVEPHVPLLEMDEWDWHRVLEVNLTGAFLMTQSVGRMMQAQGSGVIINLITQMIENGAYGSAFVASMEGLKGFTAQAARELKAYGVQVYAVESNKDHLLNKVFAVLNLRTEEQ